MFDMLLLRLLMMNTFTSSLVTGVFIFIRLPEAQCGSAFIFVFHSSVSCDRALRVGEHLLYIVHE